MQRRAAQIAGAYFLTGLAVLIAADLAPTQLDAWGLVVHGVLTLAVLVAGTWLLYRLLSREADRWARTNTELGHSRAQLAAIISSAMDAILSVDADQRVILFNQAAEKMFGVPVEEALGQPLDRFLPERYRAAHREQVQAFGKTRTSRRRMGGLGTVLGLRANGEEFPLEASISQVDLDGEKIYSVILRDQTERVRDQERITEQAALLDQASEAILVRGLDGVLRYWNLGAERLYGWPAAEAVGRSAADLLSAPDATAGGEAERASLAGGRWEGEQRQRSRWGRELVVASRWTLVRDPAGRPQAFLIVNTDVTDKKKLEAQFLRAQRLESIGTLAGGIAHDLNNILTPMLMAVKLLKKPRPDQERQNLLATLQTSVERGAELVKQVLAFAGGIEGERLPLSPRHLIREVTTILGHTLPKTIQLQAQIAPDVWEVRGDVTQLSQVLMNLCVNARDAMPNGGTLSIHAENLDLDDQFVRLHLGAKAGPHVLITVEDSGTGIPPEVIDKIFDPFFTTKEHGKGTGLGLSTALGIVKGHGGLLNVYSEVGRGSRFAIYLPAVREETKARLQAAPEAEAPAGHGELILVVDDETAILEVTRATLESSGYRAITAANGAEAMALYGSRKEEIRLVLLDMMMPVMDGRATLKALVAENPAVRVVAMSGLRAPTAISEGAEHVKVFLQKPYTADKVLNAVAAALR